MSTPHSGSDNSGAGRRWTYGDAGDRWPVRFGQIWQVGPHILGCGDIEQGHANQLFQRFGAAATSSICVVDPPFNQLNAGLFRRKAATWIDQPSSPVDFTGLLGRVVDAAKLCGLAFIEMGVASTRMLKLAIQKSGGQIIGDWSITYGKKNPCRLLAASWRPEAAVLGNDFTGVDDLDFPALVIERFSAPGDLVFDPCFGRGLMARVAHPLNRRFLGLELNPRRMAVTIDSLTKFGISPVLIGTLDLASSEVSNHGATREQRNGPRF
ncbi:MAG: DNA methyltransferase [Blastocatellia bacterium]